MRWSKTVSLVEAHAEAGPVLTGGIIDRPGRTMADKLA